MADEIVGFPQLKVDDLKKELMKRGLKTKGTKAELQERLLEFLKNDVNNDTSETEDSKIEGPDDSHDLGISTEEDELEVASNHDIDETFEVKTSDEELKEVEEESPVSAEPKPVKVTTPAIVAIGVKSPDEERRLSRGKRFGEITNELDKKKLRAERFKTTAPSNEVVYKGKTISGNELDQLKKRAERFGVISPVIDKLDETDKKTKRQQRFGVVTSVSTKPVNSSPEAAKKKRAERFGLG